MSTKKKQVTKRRSSRTRKRSLQAVDRPLTGDMRSALAKARDHWLESADGKRASNPVTLSPLETCRQFLENRLRAAFIAGADWMERQKHERKRPIVPISDGEPQIL